MRTKGITKKTLFSTQLEDREIVLQIIDTEISEFNENETQYYFDTTMNNQTELYIQELKKQGYTETVFENGYTTVLKTNDCSEFAVVSSKDTSVISIKL